jgi:hypothetical protein
MLNGEVDELGPRERLTATGSTPGWASSLEESSAADFLDKESGLEAEILVS